MTWNDQVVSMNLADDGSLTLYEEMTPSFKKD